MTKLIKIFRKGGIFLLLILFTGALEVTAQSRIVKNAQKKKEKIENRQKKAYKKARDKEIKRRYNMQGEATKGQMKEANKRAKQHNRNTISKKDPLVKRVFKKKRK